MKRILGIALILVTLCLAIGSASAFFDNTDPVHIGDIKDYDLDITDFDDETSQVDFTANVEVDISDLSSSDKKLLEDAIKDNDTAFILNLTALGSVKITIWTYQGVDDAHIDGDTLFIKHDSSYRTITGSDTEDLKLTAVSFNTTSGKLFTTDEI